MDRLNPNSTSKLRFALHIRYSTAIESGLRILSFYFLISPSIQKIALFMYPKFNPNNVSSRTEYGFGNIFNIGQLVISQVEF